MGLYDTIIFPNPIPCSFCENPIKDTQTKKFENLMLTFEVGDVIQGPLISGIIKEELYCNKCKKFIEEPNIYIVIKNFIFIDVVTDLKEAEEKLNKFNEGNLYFFLL